MANLIVTQEFEDSTAPLSPVIVTVTDLNYNPVKVDNIDMHPVQPANENARVIELTLDNNGSSQFSCGNNVWNPDPALSQQGEDIVFHVYENIGGGGRTKRGASLETILAHTSTTGHG